MGVENKEEDKEEEMEEEEDEEGKEEVVEQKREKRKQEKGEMMTEVPLSETLSPLPRSSLWEFPPTPISPILRTRRAVKETEDQNYPTCC